jgi:hypothetical protein
MPRAIPFHPAAAADFWSSQTVVDARSGRTVRVLHRADEAAWPQRLGEQAAVTWASLELFHRGRGTEVYRGRLESDGPLYYVKRFTPRSAGDHWKYLLRGPRSLRAWARARQAEALGFRAVRPVCVLTEQRGRSAPTDVLITHAEPDAISLRDRLHRPGPLAARRRLLADLGREVARWHAARLLHPDLNLGNLLVADDPDGPRFVWLDVEGNRRLPIGVPLNRRAKNLADLNYEPRGLTRTDRWRVWCAYRAAAGLGPRTSARLVRAVLQITRARWRKRGWLPPGD